VFVRELYVLQINAEAAKAPRPPSREKLGQMIARGPHERAIHDEQSPRAITDHSERF
jgi:hypothetical protein